MQVIFAALVLALAGFVFLVFLAVPRLRRHALKAVAAVFGFAAGSVGSMFLATVAYGLSGFTEDRLPAWAVGVFSVILWNSVGYGGGLSARGSPSRPPAGRRHACAAVARASQT